MHRRIQALAIVLIACAVGCGRKEPPRPAEPKPSGAERGAAAPQKYLLSTQFDSGLEQLRGIAIDGQDHIYLAGAAGVRVCDSAGKLLAAWSTSGPARCVAVDGEGNVYVGLLASVEKYDKDGKRLASWGSVGREPGQLAVVTAIALSGTDVFVADAANRCVHRFDSTGDFVNEIGKREGKSVGLVCPSPYLDCAVDKAAVLHVINPGMLRVERYKPSGELLGYWGQAGARPEDFGGCCNPTNIALLPEGSIVTAEKTTRRVKVYDANGRMLAFIGSTFFSEDAAGMDIAVDSQGRICVIDPGNGKVCVFVRARANAEKP